MAQQACRGVGIGEDTKTERDRQTVRDGERRRETVRERERERQTDRQTETHRETV